MDQYYAVMLEGDKAGDAQIRQQGLYLFIRVVCYVPKNVRFRLVLCSDNGKKDLGLCASEKGAVEQSIRLPMKEAGNMPYNFFLEKAYDSSFTAVLTDQPFPHLAQLEKGRFAIMNGQPGIILKDL